MIPPVAVVFSRILTGLLTLAAEPPMDSLPLPPLKLNGLPARVHTQGIEQVGSRWYVTGRSEDRSPKRAWLLRIGHGESEWESWDITPGLLHDGGDASLDHPGGFQSDGTNLWIPIAESRRNGRSVVHAYSLDEIQPGHELKPATVFKVEDHIGAIAVCRNPDLLLGANWDSERVYLWDFSGKLVRTFDGDSLRSRELGFSVESGRTSGLAVQDWKFDGRRLWVSGLLKSAGVSARSFPSGVVEFEDFLKPDSASRRIPLPEVPGVQLGREGMTVGRDGMYFLPEDLGATNRIFRLRTAGPKTGK